MFDLKLLFFVFKMAHKLFMCSLHLLSPEQQATFGQKLFFFFFNQREKPACSECSPNSFSDASIRIVTWGKKTEEHSPVIAGIKLKKTVSSITEPS